MGVDINKPVISRKGEEMPRLLWSLKKENPFDAEMDCTRGIFYMVKAEQADAERKMNIV